MPFPFLCEISKKNLGLCPNFWNWQAHSSPQRRDTLCLRDMKTYIQLYRQSHEGNALLHESAVQDGKFYRQIAQLFAVTHRPCMAKQSFARCRHECCSYACRLPDNVMDRLPSTTKSATEACTASFLGYVFRTFVDFNVRPFNFWHLRTFHVLHLSHYHGT